MKFSKYIVGPIIVAILAALMQAIDQFLAGNTIIGTLLAGGGSWIAFQAWAIYFLGGCNIRGGVKGFVMYAVGIIASIAIMMMGGAFGGFWGVPLAVLIIVIPAICCERVEFLSYVPALFVGAGAYFGIMGYIAPTAPAPYTGNFWAYFAVEMFYCLFGLVWGWLTVTLRGAYEKSLSKAKEQVSV